MLNKVGAGNKTTALGPWVGTMDWDYVPKQERRREECGWYLLLTHVIKLYQWLVMFLD